MKGLQIKLKAGESVKVRGTDYVVYNPNDFSVRITISKQEGKSHEEEEK